VHAEACFFYISDKNILLAAKKADLFVFQEGSGGILAC
jgi:hypothetical protein